MQGMFAPIMTAVFLAGVAMGQPVSKDAKDEMVREWKDLEKHQDWDVKAKHPDTEETTGAEHCLNALDLATRPQPDTEGALNELIIGSLKGSTAYLLPPELQGNLWEWLASAAPPAPNKEVRSKALDAAKTNIDKYYSSNKAGLMDVYYDIQKHHDLRAIYGLLKLTASSGKIDAALVGLMEQFRLSYVNDKQKVFNYVIEKFQ